MWDKIKIAALKIVKINDSEPTLTLNLTLEVPLSVLSELILSGTAVKIDSANHKINSWNNLHPRAEQLLTDAGQANLLHK